MTEKKDKLNQLQKKFNEIQERYMNNNDVCFDEFKDTIMFGKFSMGDIVELYGALAYIIDGDIVERACEYPDGEGWMLIPEHKCIGETILKKDLLPELEAMDYELRDENKYLKQQLKEAEEKIKNCREALGVFPLKAPF